MKILKNLFDIILDIIMAIVILLIAIAIFYIIQTKVQKKSFANIMGYTALEVITGSMANTINVEDFIIVKIVNTIYENDIIVYQDGEDLITHRLIKIDGDKLITKGDANNSKDVPINKSQVIGKVKYIIPKAGIWKQVLTEPSVLISLLLFIIIITVITYYKP